MCKPRIFLSLLFLIVAISCNNRTDKSKNVEVHRYFDTIDSKSINGSVKLKYVDTTYRLLISGSNDSTNRRLLSRIAREYFILDENDSYLAASKELHNRSISTKDIAFTATALYYIGDYYENGMQTDSAFKYYSHAEKLYKTINDTLNIGRTKLYKAGVLYDAGIFTESEIQTAEALQFLRDTGNDRLVYESYNLMALNLKELSDYKNSIHYFNLALEQLDLMEQKKYDPDKLIKSKASVYNNMGGLYEKTKNYGRAIELYQKGLRSKGIRQNHPRLYAMLLNNLAGSALEVGDKEIQIEALLLESLKIRQDNKIEAGVVSSKISIGAYYLHRKEMKKGLQYLREGYELAKKINSTYDSKNALQLLSKNDSLNSNHYNSLYLKLNDSLQQVERTARNKFARIAYETNQIEKKNTLLSKRNRIITLVGLSITLLLIGFIIIYRLRSKNKELLLIKGQSEANEKIYQLMLGQRSETDKIIAQERNRIAMELHDGIVNRIFTTRFNLMQLQPEQTKRKEELVHELMKAETEIRKVSHQLQQNLLFEDSSFQKALHSLITAQQNEFNTEFDISIDKFIDWSLVTSENKVHIYRIIQEALQNINKYAQAKNADIILLRTGDKITINIIDNGVGFDSVKTDGIGLKNIKQRVLALKGELKIVSSNEEGTTLKIVF